MKLLGGITMKKITALLILLAILISCSGCSMVSLITDKVMGGSDAQPEEDYFDSSAGNFDSITGETFYHYEVIMPGGDQDSFIIGGSQDGVVIVPDGNGGYIISTEGTEPTEEPTQAPTEAPAPGDYKYDIGKRIENPSDKDFQVLYDMVQNIGIYWSYFDDATVDGSNVIDFILNSEGFGAFYAYNFNFYTDQVNSGDYENSRRCYYIDDIEWVAMAVFGEVLDHNSLNNYGYDNRYTEGVYYYRYNMEDYMGSPYTEFTSFDAVYEELPNGNWKFTIHAQAVEEFDFENTLSYEITLEAIPMYSADLGTYWRLISFERH